MNQELIFILTLLKKAFITFGTTFFAVSATISCSEAIYPAFIAAGTYAFLEASKYYVVQPTKKVNSTTKSYNFLV